MADAAPSAGAPLRVMFEMPPGAPQPPADLVASFCGTAARLIADGRALQPFAFLGRDVNAKPERVLPIDTRNVATKDASMANVSKAAAEIGAQYVILVIESWYLEPRSPAEAEALRDSGRGIADREDRRECVMVAVEVPGGQWLAYAPIHREPERSWVDAFAFRWAAGSEGRLFGVLSGADGD